MFASLDGSNCPFGMQMIRQRIVDNVNFRIGKQSVIRTVGTWNLFLFSVSVSCFLHTRGNSEQLVSLRGAERRDERVIDSSRGEQSPIENFVGHGYSAFANT
jgi:hypothetical protein